VTGCRCGVAAGWVESGISSDYLVSIRPNSIDSLLIGDSSSSGVDVGESLFFPLKLRILPNVALKNAEGGYLSLSSFFGLTLPTPRPPVGGLKSLVARSTAEVDAGKSFGGDKPVSTLAGGSDVVELEDPNWDLPFVKRIAAFLYTRRQMWEIRATGYLEVSST
jgi:hypothetical protein